MPDALDITTEKPKRLSLSQIVELLLTRSVERSSVSLTRNAKGETQIDVKVNTGAEGEATTLEEAERKAVAVYERLREAYPAATQHDDAAIELTRNAKGETQIEVSLRTTEQLPTVEQAAERAEQVYTSMRSRYPMLDGRTAKPGSVKE